MPKTTPPKGRPTTGRLDRQVAKRTWKSRSTTRKFLWVVLALGLLAAVLVLGTGTGGNGLDTPVTGSVLPLLLLSRSGLVPAPAPRW